MSRFRKSKNDTLFSVTRINKDIIHLVFDSKKEMNMTMIRFQEFYESPKFKGTIFTLGQYRDWYIKETGDFNWYLAVEGLNMKSEVFEPFLRGLFDPLTTEEQEILDRVGRGTSFKYLIASFDGADDDIIEHEICHAIYGTVPDYAKKVDNIISKYDTKKITKWLKSQEYDDHVIVDETHAYVLCNLPYMKENGLKVEDKMVTELLKLRRKYKPKTVY